MIEFCSATSGTGGRTLGAPSQSVSAGQSRTCTGLVALAGSVARSIREPSSAIGKSRQSCIIAAVLFLSLGDAFHIRADQSIILRSGNGTIGTQDAQVRFLAYGRTGNVTPTAQNFVSVETGTFAHVVSPYPTYVQKLPTDPLAQWIATTSSLSAGSALYAIPFVVTDSVIAAATLNLGYAVDNAINGVYINGSPISGNSDDGDYHGEYYFLRSDIAPLLRPNSTNWLYLNVTDGGTLSALIFKATITTQGIAQTPNISPSYGGNTGQVTVQVIASGFQPGAQISLTGIGSPIVGTNPTVVSPNILTATLNLTGASAGVRTVTVTNPGGTSVTLPNAFTVQQGVAPNLQIQKIGTPAVHGRNETFFITVTNTGNTDAGLTPITESLEPWFTFVNASPAPTSIQLANFLDQTYNGFLEWDIASVPVGGSTTVAYTVLLDPTFPTGDTVHGPACLTKVDFACGTPGAVCLRELVPKACGIGFELGGPWGSFFSCVLAVEYCVGAWAQCEDGLGRLCSSATSTARGSVDPNDLSSSGFGNQKWVRGNLPIQYALSFENLSSATKSATTVAVTALFDSVNLDTATLAVGPINFGNSVYTPPSVPLAVNPFSADIDLRPTQNLIVRTTAELNPNTNQMTVNLLSIDPTTGLSPVDPLVGFLPPGVGGTVLFTIMPKPALVTGTTIQEMGTVVFDVNPAINTPNSTNTIDNSLPKSQVSPLSATQACANFQVNWSGSDIGSGLGGFTVFASDSNGAFQPWLSNTTASGAVYQGVVGHKYSFYSLATDNAGNVEAPKTAAESVTNLISAGSCGPPSLGVQVTDTFLTGNTLTVTLKLTNSGVTDALAVNINQITARTLAGSGTVTLSTPALPIPVGALGVGASQTITLTLNVPSSVTRFSLVESGTLIDIHGTSFNYSIAEAIIP